MARQFLIRYRRLLIIITHLLLVWTAYSLAFLLRFEFAIPSNYYLVFLKTLPLVLVIKVLVFYYFGIFQGLWRYVSITDLWQIVKAGTVSSLVFVIALVFDNLMHGFPRSVIALDWVFSLTLISGIRLITRLIREKIHPASGPKKKHNALIIGAGQAGVLMLKECRNNPGMGLHVCGFIDDDPLKRNVSIQGVKVLGNRSRIPEIVSKMIIEEVILAIPSAKGEVIRQILSFCQVPGVKIKTVPGLAQLINGDLQLKPREVRPEDLLGRDAVVINEKEIRSYIKGKHVLVTGAGGSIGSEICRQIASFEPEKVVLLDHNENDIYFLNIELKRRFPGIKFLTVIGDVRDIGVLKSVFSKHRPQVIFHSAAHKHVPLMQDNPIAAVKNNIFGSRNIIYAANHYQAERFVFISTDKAVNPVNIMGMTKRIAEMILQSKAKVSKTKFMAVRFGNVLGSAGSVVPLFLKQIEEGGPVTVTHPEAERYFMSIPEAVSLVLQAAAFGKGGEIFILDMGEQIKIIDIAKNLITFSGLQLGRDIDIEFVGLREGEKLSEELLLNIEKDRVTKNKFIYVTEPNHFDPVRLRKQLKEMEALICLRDDSAVVKKMKEIIF
jgi:FlaA1/EpsC-like NDP-sugar epimerase